MHTGSLASYMYVRMFFERRQVARGNAGYSTLNVTSQDLFRSANHSSDSFTKTHQEHIFLQFELVFVSNEEHAVVYLDNINTLWKESQTW